MKIITRVVCVSSIIITANGWCDNALQDISSNTIPSRGVPSGCDPKVMSEAYWKVWSESEQRKIDADIEANRKADGVFAIPAKSGTLVEVEQIDHEFRFGAHIFNFNQLGKKEWNDIYKASYGKNGLFNQATVAFYWNNYEPEPGKQRANAAYDDTEAYWNSLSLEAAQLERFWRRPAAKPVIDYLKMMDVRIHGHILIWGTAKPYWIYDWFCPENEKEYFDTLGIPRHSTFPKRAKAGAEGGFGFDSQWKKAWRNAYGYVTEETLGEKAPQFAANMRKIFRKRILDVAKDFGLFVDSWDVVNESCVDWKVYRKSRTALPVWKSVYGLMPGDYPLNALLDAKEAFPETTDLVINDYAINDNFLAQVKDLENEGARIDVVGCQMHIFNTNDCMRLALGATNVNWVGTPATIERRLDTMAKTGKPLHVSEVTITSPGMDDKSRQIQAILTRNIYRKWFSHKAAMGITWWNTVDGGGVYGEPLVSGLFTRDMKRKRAYDALDELINKEWRTKLEVKVKGEGEGCGVVAFRGFRGKYRLNWICDKCGEKHTRVVRLTGDGVSENASKVASPIDCYVPMAKYKVDGKAVILPKGERYVDLKKIYPNEVVSGRDGKRWAKVETSVIAPKDGEYVMMRYNEYWGEIIVNGESLGEFNGPVTPTPIKLKLKKGENTIIYRTRAGSGGVWKCGLLVHGDSPLKLDI